MNPLLPEFRHEFRETTLDLLWRQWTALGVPGQTADGSRRLVDPEALLLFTCSLGRFDARLFDEVLAWLRVHERFVSVQRLKSLAHEYDFAGQRVLAAIGGFVARPATAAKWARLADPAAPLAPAEPLFFSSDGNALPVVKAKDPVFEARGYWREQVALPHGRTQPFNPERPEALLLRLRALFGVNSRAEIVAYLLTHERAGASEIAATAGYFRRTIYNALVDMAMSGLVQRGDGGGENRYRLAGPFWRSLGTSQWVTWPPLFRALERIWQFLADDRTEKLDGLLLVSELHLVTQAVGKEAHRAGYDAFAIPAPAAHAPDAYLDRCLQQWRALLHHAASQR